MPIKKLKVYQLPLGIYLRPDVYDVLETIRGAVKSSTFVQDLIAKENMNAK
jgi:hypothetical protein